MVLCMHLVAVNSYDSANSTRDTGVYQRALGP